MIIVISGRMASGKTTLAKTLADEFGGTVASFGDHVRAIASGQGRGSDRETLQQIGQTAVDLDADRFVADFLAGLEPAAGVFLVLDGLRHVTVRDALREYARKTGAEVRFVHVESDEEQRASRLRARGQDDASIVAHDAHASEADVRDRLRDEADLIVHRVKDTSSMINEIATRLLAPAGLLPYRG